MSTVNNLYCNLFNICIKEALKSNVKLYRLKSEMDNTFITSIKLIPFFFLLIINYDFSEEAFYRKIF